MGFARGSLLGFVGVLLFLSLLIGNLFWIFSSSLEYGQLKSEITPLISLKINKTLPDVEFMNFSCINESEFVFYQSQFETQILIPCEIVDLGREEILSYSEDYILEDSYYGEYDCSFVNCLFGKGFIPMFAFSKTSKNYFQGRFLFFLLISLILTGVVFLLVSQKLNFLPILGGLIIISAIPLKKLGVAITFLLPSFFEEFGLVFVSKAEFVSSIILTFGLIVLVLGLIWKFLKFDRVKKKFTRREVEEIVKAEANKSNVKKAKE